MTQPTSATYTGPIEALKECAVLVRACDKDETVEVQFTDVNERTPDECAGKRDVTDHEQLMFGWHEMPKSDFTKVTKAKKRPTLMSRAGETGTEDDG